MSSIDNASPAEWDRLRNMEDDIFGDYCGPDTKNFKPVPRKPWAETVKRDEVNKPAHYQGKYECIDVIEDRLSTNGFQGYLEGNVWKYLYRYRSKNGVTDLKKAQWYLERLIRSAV